MPVPEIGNQFAHDEAESVGMNQSAVSIKCIQYRSSEGFCFHRRPNQGAVNRLAIMADLSRLSGKLGSKSRLVRRNEGPPVNENLCANLFSNGRAIGGDRAALGSGNALLEIQPGGVFGRVPTAAPPEDRAFFNDVIQPRLADILG